MFGMKVFVETDADARLAKRVIKDTDELGRDMDQVHQVHRRSGHGCGRGTSRTPTNWNWNWRN